MLLTLAMGEGAQQQSGKNRGFGLSASIWMLFWGLPCNAGCRHGAELPLFWCASHGFISAIGFTRRLGGLADAQLGTNRQTRLLGKGDGDAVHDVGLYARSRNGEGFTRRDGQGLCRTRRRTTGDAAARNFSG